MLLSTAVLGLMISQVKTNFAVNLFVNTMGEKIAKALHNDDDHLELDALLDKLLQPDHDMTEAEMFELKNRCNHILCDKCINKSERQMCGVMAAICEWVLITKFKKTKMLK